MEVVHLVTSSLLAGGVGCCCCGRRGLTRYARCFLHLPLRLSERAAAVSSGCEVGRVLEQRERIAAAVHEGGLLLLQDSAARTTAASPLLLLLLLLLPADAVAIACVEDGERGPTTVEKEVVGG